MEKVTGADFKSATADDNKKLFIETYGCQMNVADSEVIASVMQMAGYSVADTLEEADAVFMNTCSIRDNAEQKILNRLEFFHSLKKKKRGLIVGVLGCMAERVKDDLITNHHVDLVVGPDAYLTLPELIASVEAGEKAMNVELSTTETYRDVIPSRICGNHISGFVSIMRGCNNFCTYCIVPYTRGRERSRDVESILNEVADLVAKGYKEVTLLGQNVNSYHGEDASGRERNLAYLLNRVAEIDGIKRIRYTTSYPADVDDDLIRCHKELDKLMPYLHLPIQSGSDAVLKKMNRRHTRDEYLRVVEKLKEANPAIGMSSDFIVGFPGETEEDFQQTLDVVNRVQYVQAFSFKYSRRPGTPAAVMDGQVDEKVKKERLQVLQDLLFSYQTKFNKNSIGKVMPVLFESKGRHKGQLVGRTPYMQNLHAEADGSLLNKIVEVRVTDASTNSLSGEVL